MRTVLAWVLVPLVAVPNSAWAQTGNPLEVLQDLPEGSTIRLTLRDGMAISGTFSEEQDDAILVNVSNVSGSMGPTSVGAAPGMSTSRIHRVGVRRVARAEISSIAVLSIARTYRASAAPEPRKVQRVVQALGTGKVAVRTAGSPFLKGRIRDIHDRGFAVVHGGETTRIAFADVQEIRRGGLPGWAKGAIIGGGASGVLMLIYGLSLINCGCR